MMNVKKQISYYEMADEYFSSAQKIHTLLEKLKSDKELKFKNPKEYNWKIACIRAIYNDCLDTGNLLKERAERYESAQ